MVFVEYLFSEIIYIKFNTHYNVGKSLYYITEMNLGLICIIVTLVEINYYHHFYLSRSEALPEINCHFNEMRFWVVKESQEVLTRPDWSRVSNLVLIFSRISKTAARFMNYYSYLRWLSPLSLYKIPNGTFLHIITFIQQSGNFLFKELQFIWSKLENSVSHVRILNQFACRK